jgi:hypothetical protein
MSGLDFLLIGLGIVAVAGGLAFWYRTMMRKLAAIWAPNTRIVQGTFSRFRALLRGTYHDRPVMAYLGNQRGMATDDVGPSTYSYTVRMTVPPGSDNWTLASRFSRKGAKPEWVLQAKPGPAERLKAVGLLDAVESAPRNWQLRYRAGSGRLEISISGVGMYFSPNVATFQAQLDLLLRLEAVTRAAAGKPLLQAA